MNGTENNGSVSRRAAGAAGEDAACLWLEKNGFTVVRRNFTVRGGEIDIVAEDEKNTLFIEVKLRKSGAAQRPAAAVTRTKQSRIQTAAARYMAEFSPEKPPRYDVIELVGGAGHYEIRHIKGAFFGESSGERKNRVSFRERYK